ncbi:MAG TPA: hypothetical protein VHA52_01310, partial [Candidatus Babeliaceae bacterium]|nr:hypothetical protein [Candidatus Babeliaceae bacterium]
HLTHNQVVLGSSPSGTTPQNVINQAVAFTCSCFFISFNSSRTKTRNKVDLLIWMDLSGRTIIASTEDYLAL